jgi:hypothetical protein
VPDRRPLERRRSAAAPVVAALLAVAVVVLPAVAVRWGQRAGPEPPVPPPPRPVSLDVGGQSLDRCAVALRAVGAADRYPERGAWRPLAVAFTGDTVVTLLGGEVPFACVTGPRTVQVSDPAAAVPVGPARLLLTTAGGVVVAVAPEGAAVSVGLAGADPPAGGSRHVLRATGVPLTRPGQLAVAVTGPAGPRGPVPPDRLAPPALDLTDLPPRAGAWPAGTDDLLHRCRAAQPPVEPPRPWWTAHVLADPRGDPAAALLVAVGPGAIGGCAVRPDGVTPLRTWHVGRIGDGARPFTWLPRPGETLPDLATDVAAGPVQSGVTRLEVLATTGHRWEAGVAGGTFATRVPAGAPTDPRGLTVRALDARGRVVYEGAAAD